MQPGDLAGQGRARRTGARLYRAAGHRLAGAAYRPVIGWPSGRLGVRACDDQGGLAGARVGLAGGHRRWRGDGADVCPHRRAVCAGRPLPTSKAEHAIFGPIKFSSIGALNVTAVDTLNVFSVTPPEK